MTSNSSIDINKHTDVCDDIFLIIPTMSYRYRLMFLITLMMVSAIKEAHLVPISPKRYCGVALADMLSVVCHGKYNGYYERSISKRSLDSGGIVEECCVNACSLETLIQYCAAEDKSAPLDIFDGPEIGSRELRLPKKAKHLNSSSNPSKGVSSEQHPLLENHVNESNVKKINDEPSVPDFEIGTVAPSSFRPVFMPDYHKHPVWNSLPHSNSGSDTRPIQ